ncbi:probable WRKY transcription factor 4 [Dioscorea cayenensis subsp. rotundata]|uniref:Probable WRKY transcription factor 4 n=1 Tax=Dioscorea cayennensis subsp. rotundata TaxID=55577 RepID=A0AB40BVE8_DIOCR|nr:probable WRKY transcription factor 4 [Dioscorea cayenensis subsp. rotundata]
MSGQPPPPPPPPQPPPPPPPPLERENQTQSSEANQPQVPEDGYEWKKYGQKFIRGIGQNRSYFKCKNKRCGVIKRIEWPRSHPDRLRVIYVGGREHTHPPPSTSKSRRRRFNFSGKSIQSC